MDLLLKSKGFFLINKLLFQTFLEGFLQIENVKQYSQPVLFDLSDTKNKKTSTDLQIFFFVLRRIVSSHNVRRLQEIFIFKV